MCDQKNDVQLDELKQLADEIGTDLAGLQLLAKIGRIAVMTECYKKSEYWDSHHRDSECVYCDSALWGTSYDASCHHRFDCIYVEAKKMFGEFNPEETKVAAPLWVADVA